MDANYSNAYECHLNVPLSRWQRAFARRPTPAANIDARRPLEHSSLIFLAASVRQLKTKVKLNSIYR